MLKLDKWWLDWAYLEWRLPIAPFINTVGFFVDNSTSSQQLIDPKWDYQLLTTATQIFLMNFFFDQLRK